jgi:hypothetical protein
MQAHLDFFCFLWKKIPDVAVYDVQISRFGTVFDREFLKRSDFSGLYIDTLPQAPLACSYHPVSSLYFSLAQSGVGSQNQAFPVFCVNRGSGDPNAGTNAYFCFFCAVWFNWNQGFPGSYVFPCLFGN